MSFFKEINNKFSSNFGKTQIFFRKIFIDFFKNKILLKKSLFTLSMMIIFVVIGTITIPGISITGEIDNEGFLGILNTVGGGGLRQFSLVSLGISPFISASLVMTLGQTKLFPPLQRLSQSGPRGRIKINYITHAMTLFFGLMQAILIIQSLGSGQFASIDEGFNTTWFKWFVLPIILLSGTFFSIFISEQITHKGVGNGTSMLILAGVLTTLPTTFTSLYSYIFKDSVSDNLEMVRFVFIFLIFIFVFILLMFIISFVYQAERRIPIQYTGVGRSKNIKDLSYLPLKLAPAGIMPVIFASLLISFPGLIVNVVEMKWPSEATKWIKENLQLTSWFGLTIYTVAIFVIGIALGIQQSKVDKITEDFTKNSTFIPGIRPGNQTEDYLLSIVIRLSVFASFYLLILGTAEYYAQLFGVPRELTFSGTTIMILVTVSLETLGQMSARIQTQNIFKIRTQAEKIRRNISDNNEFINEDNKGGSILW